ncbi:hypothetical protein MB901379_02130 [Mycobacterium basiliense]|uniref:Uncharacterized protein n=1 Tax=Mycobacterium basiliense TaxID=2094119 RepID=A0A3S4CVD0_9MYCO|nr:hypothetical protein [Mycobacterium basiliense]VDM88568.1 hypothetical protein MB901379_02130 [Mycobacterium basiliense]
MQATGPIRTFSTNRWLRAQARPVSVAAAAGVGYGSWATLTHYHLGMAVALKAGSAQFALSLTATLVLVMVLEQLFRWPSNSTRGFWLAAVGTSVLAAMWLIGGHVVAGTSNIALTIAPNLIIGTTVNFAYSSALLAHARRNADK